jgi:hypothetical protein
VPPERDRPAGPSERVLAQFDRALLQAGAQPGSLWLHGEERGTGGQRAQVFFSGARTAAPMRPAGLQGPAQSGSMALPAQWQAVQVCELVDGQGRHDWQLRGSQGIAHVAARAVQVHREPVQAFYQALPFQAPSRLVRLGWCLLLALLRIPGVASLLARLRSR